MNNAPGARAGTSATAFDYVTLMCAQASPEPGGDALDLAGLTRS